MDISKELGKMMLQGWILLEETCSFNCNIPLVENKKDNKIYCVSCKNYFKRENNSIILIQQLSSSSSTTLQKKNNSSEINNGNESIISEAELQKKKEKSNDISKKIGEKLLQGWTLLEENCPKCYIPLVRNLEKKMFCLNCDTLVILSEEYDPSIHQLISEQYPDNNINKINLDKKEEKKLFTKEENFNYSTIKNNIDYKKIIESSLHSLYMKLSEYQEHLLYSDNIQKSKDICSFIIECSSAIQSLQSIYK